MTYNHDIDHCAGNGCPLCERCRRYHLGKMADEMQHPYTWWVNEEYDAETNGCVNMLPIK